MRIMVDTNVLFSAILFPQGRAAEALSHCIRKHELVICSYVLDELKRVVRKKFPSRLSDLDTFFEKLSFELVYTPEHIEKALFPIRDPKDYPILYTAVIENVDVLLSGDDDFSDTGLTHPEIVTPAEFLKRFSRSGEEIENR